MKQVLLGSIIGAVIGLFWSSLFWFILTNAAPTPPEPIVLDGKLWACEALDPATGQCATYSIHR